MTAEGAARIEPKTRNQRKTRRLQEYEQDYEVEARKRAPARTWARQKRANRQAHGHDSTKQCTGPFFFLGPSVLRTRTGLVLVLQRSGKWAGFVVATGGKRERDGGGRGESHTDKQGSQTAGRRAHPRSISARAGKGQHEYQVLVTREATGLSVCNWASRDRRRPKRHCSGALAHRQSPSRLRIDTIPTTSTLRVA